MLDVSARLRADPLADRVVAEAYPEGRGAIMALNQALRALDRNADAVPADLPAPLREYLESGADIGRAAGGWDEEKLALGARVYVDYCVHVPMVLQLGTMPLLYAAEHGVKVLTFTGRLTRNAHRRSIETAQMVQDVMDPEGFSPSGRARRTTQKVRLLHAAVRHAALTSGWDTPTLGQPINQDDLLGTLFGFTITVLDGLEKLGAAFTAEEAEAYYYRWRAVGELMGIERDLIPPDLVSARAVFAAQQERMFAPSEDGRRLMATWLLALEQQVPIQAAHASLPAMCAWMAGPRAAAALGLPDPAEVERKLAGAGAWFRQLDTTLQHGSVVRRGLNTVASHLFHVLYVKERGLERHSFELPEAVVPAEPLFAGFVAGLSERDRHVLLSSVPRLLGMVAWADGRFDALERSEVRRIVDRRVESELGDDFRWSWEARRELGSLLSGARGTELEDQEWLWRLGAVLDEMPAPLAGRYAEAALDLCRSVAEASGTMLWLGLGISGEEADVLQRIGDALKVHVAPVELRGSSAWRHLRRLVLAPGEAAWAEGDASPSVAFVESGKVEIVRGGVRIDVSRTGEILGEMSLYTGRPRSASVRAVGDARLLVLDRAGYEALRREGSEVVVNLERRILELQGARLRRLDRFADTVATGPLPSPGVLDRIRALLPASRAAAPGRIDVAAALARTPLFQGEAAEALEAIAAQLEHRLHPAGHFLTRQGEASEDVYIVCQGTVDVFVSAPDEDQVLHLGELGPGSACGLSSLLGDRGRMASCVAREPVEVLVLGREAWRRYLSEASPVASAVRAAMIRAYADQLDDAGARVAEGGVADLRRRLARLEHSGTQAAVAGG